MIKFMVFDSNPRKSYGCLGSRSDLKGSVSYIFSRILEKDLYINGR